MCIQSTLLGLRQIKEVDLINENRCEINYFETFSGHCFRHTYATRCFEAGVAPKAVQKQLGHANLKMTMDLYTHLLDDQRDDELAKFSSYSDTVFDKDSLSAPPKVVPLPKVE
ncbi:MAG: tyrosine-type recombinase/integrase [Oscillospiraceae bacterium]|nr:tyrosine-type recombinase/integrase [Oscillospiraceae bacterium]